MGYTPKRLLILAFLILFLLPVPLSAADHGLSIEGGASYSFTYSSAISEFDRNLWLAGIQVTKVINDTLTIAAGYTFGGILYQTSGHVMLQGPTLELRHSYQNLLYAGVGVSLLRIDRFRSSPQIEIKVLTGFPLKLGSSLTMLNELQLSASCTSPPLLSAGVRNAVSISL